MRTESTRQRNGTKIVAAVTKAGDLRTGICRVLLPPSIGLWSNWSPKCRPGRGAFKQREVCRRIVRFDFPARRSPSNATTANVRVRSLRTLCLSKRVVDSDEKFFVAKRLNEKSHRTALHCVGAGRHIVASGDDNHTRLRRKTSITITVRSGL